MGENAGNKEKTGKVWIAGAGPGDAGLLTVKTDRLIRNADVVVYDALVSTEILSRIPEGTEVIDVGKHAGNHPVPQEEINRILVREAQKGKTVLRLKGGDPFVFGRGGEEMEFLAEAGISFAMVPGIPSAVAVPAYAGIPVTHRDYTSSFHVVTGHARKNQELEIDFQSLVNLNGTIVFLMSVSSMEYILNGLQEAGMDADVPAAVIERGTTAEQKQVTATVGTLKARAEEEGIQSPAVILVGQVCALSEKLHWADQRRLDGRQFLVTRPRQNSSGLVSRLRELGAQVIEYPGICTETIRTNKVLESALEGFARQPGEGWLVFTSPIGVSVFFQQLRELKIDLRKIFGINRNVKIAAVGSATAAALEEHGLFADVVPEKYYTEDLGKAIAGAAGSRESRMSPVSLFAVRAEQGSEALLPPLLEAGIDVRDVPLYRTRYETHPFLKERVEALFQNEEIDAVTFTSASTVRGFVQEMDHTDLTRIRAVCIGEQTAREARRHGMQVLTAPEVSVEAMVEKILEVYHRKKEI